MKKLLIFVVAIFAALAVSCNKDEGGKNGNEEILGTWLMRADEYHYFDVTFKKNGTYEWLWQGAGGRMLDTGTYKYENKVITTTATKFQEEDYESKQMKDAQMPEEWNGVRTMTVVEDAGAIAWWRWKNDYFIEDSDYFRGDVSGPIIFFKEGADPGIKTSDLKGTWEIRAEDGIDRLIIGDSDFTQYTAWKNSEIGGGYSVTKEIGRWFLKGCILTLEYQKVFTSSKRFWNPATQANEYIYYKVDPETLEAEQWESYSQNYSLEWYIYLKDGKLYTPSFGTFSKK